MRLRSLIAALVVTVAALSAQAVLPAVAGEGELTPSQREAMERLVREYLLKNPEVVIEAIRTFQTREQRAKQDQAQADLASRREELENDPSSPVGGNVGGDVTIVEFFDYRCGFCKRVFPTVMALIKSDGNIRYVFKELPILGPESVVASRAALAAWRLDRDKYFAFHSALMDSRGSLPQSKVMALAAENGLDVERLRREMASPEIEAILGRNLQLAESLNINGTPTFVIGGKLIPGAVSAETLTNLVADTRKACRESSLC